MATIKGYKVFNPDWTCRGFQYKVGETFTHNGNIGVCKSGFHFCQNASDCFVYYGFDSDNKVAEIEAIGLVKTEGDKSVTDKIKIVREISWHELLTIVNTGKGCTGLCNSGDYNTGNNNAGDKNTGNNNVGNRNTGDENLGGCNTGNMNTNCYNTGDSNTGYNNTGDCNKGCYNAGDFNMGYYNTGDYNTGNRNSGDWNSTSFSTGFFNSVESPIYMFNKPTSLSYNEIFELPGMRVLRWNYKNSRWIFSVEMTDEEKKAHPEHETIGGYLKTVDFKTACRDMWNKLEDGEKKLVTEIPNFDPEVFKEITGIDVTE